jgi:hypothetical protein
MKTNNHLVECIANDIWCNHIFYYILPLELCRLPVVCRYFKALVSDNKSTELNDLWKFQYNLFINNNNKEQLKELVETLELPQLKKLYTFCDTGDFHYYRMFRDIVQTMNSYPECFNEVYFNMKLMKSVLNTKWTYSGQFSTRTIKLVFVGEKHARTTEFLVTATTNAFWEDFPYFDQVCF